ncbi:AAA family ATPase [bacterium]|nr:AAA family ATPase [bacterium]
MSLNISALIPRIVARYDGKKPWQNWIEGSVLFADVSGFTPMSEALSPLGAEGAELLTDILNDYFSEMISLVSEYCGEIMKFGGDAVLCFFPGTDTFHQAIYSAKLMQDAMAKFAIIHTPIQDFSLMMKIGLAHGKVLLAGVGREEHRCDYIFAGSAVDLTAEAEHYASAGEIILACTKTDLAIQGLEVIPLGADFYKLKSVRPVSTMVQEPVIDSTDLTPYVIGEIAALVAKGYDHYIGTLQGAVPVFISFTGFTYSQKQFDLQFFHSFFSMVMDITHRYQGRLNRISMGDKGSTFFILFGSPVPLEKKEELACIWALELIAEVRKEFPSISLKIGMNSGRVFSGLVGGHDRFDYTIMGDAVNFAARLMQNAQDNQICVSEAIKDLTEEKYENVLLGKHKFKGKKELLPVYALNKKRQQFDVKQTVADFTGRSTEVTLLLEALDKARKDEPSMIVLEGVPGIGKSFLANHVLGIGQQKHWQVTIGRGDITLRNHPYAPWLSCLTSLFFQNKSPGLESINALLDEIDPQFIEFTAWHADFFKVKHDLSMSEYDEETKKRLFHHQLSLIILHFAQKNPVILFLDDLHWFDSLSLELLVILLDHLKDQQFFLLCTTRPGWHREPFLNRDYCRIIELGNMDRQTVITLAEKTLQGPIRSDLIELLIKHTEGNPFFTLHLLRYLIKSDYLEKRLDQWAVRKDVVIDKAFSNEEIILTQLHQLSPDLNILIRFATCIGSTFNIRLMKKAMGRDFKQKYWHELLEQDLFVQIEADLFAFQHTLIQNTVYNSIPKKERVRIHGKIGRSIETLFRSDLIQWYPNLANHYFLASVPDKAIEYCILAGDQLNQKLSFNECAHFYRNAYHLLEEKDDVRKWSIALSLARTLIVIGNLDESLKLVHSVKQLTSLSHNPELAIQADLIEYDTLHRKSDFSYVASALELLKLPQSRDKHIRHQILYFLGFAHHKKAEFDDAERYFQEILAEDRKQTYQDVTTVKAILLLAEISEKTGKIDEAHQIINNGIAIAQNAKMFYQELRLQIKKGLILEHMNNKEDARQLYLSLIPSCEKIGDMYLLASVLLNLGQISFNLQQFDQAKSYLTEASSFFERIGTLNGKAKALNILGAIAFMENDLPTSQAYYLNSLNITLKLGEKWEIAELYYNLTEVSHKLKEFYEQKSSEYLLNFKQIVEALNNPYFQQAYKDLKTKIQPQLQLKKDE